MANKNIGFLEEHIEKLVLAVIGLTSIAILVLRVLISPNYVQYENKKFSPSEVDNYILTKKAEPLLSKLGRLPLPIPAYDPNADEFQARIQSALGDMDIDRSLPQPFVMSAKSNGRKYDLPDVGSVSDVTAEHLRAVAYFPPGDTDERASYSNTSYEPNDLDLVTVEAKFDVAGLFDRFYECFASDRLSADGRDPCLAKPVFAAVQLQRKELLGDGNWSDWQNVPRTRIDPQKDLFLVSEKVNDLPPGGIKVQMLRFDSPDVAVDLLQPETYKIASADEEWFPPTLHRKYIKTLKDIEMQEKIQARTEETEKREEERRSLRSSSKSNSSDAMLGLLGGTSRNSDDSRRDRRDRSDRRRDDGREGRTRTRPTREEVLAAEKEEKLPPAKERPKTLSTSDIYDEFDNIRITTIDPLDMSGGLLFWAFDDTIKPDATYCYRVRLGVFNPIAGTDRFTEQYKDFKDDVILWSEYSPETELIQVPGMLYFFPYRVNAKAVTIQVSKFALGYWYSQDFTVKQGELIGSAAEPRPLKDEEKDATLPAMVDYSTGAVLVDAVAVNDWLSGSGLKQRAYYDMLYSRDCADIRHIPAERRYWPEALSAKYSEIKRMEKDLRKPLRPWGGTGTIRTYEPSPATDQPSDSDTSDLEDFMRILQGGGRR